MRTFNLFFVLILSTLLIFSCENMLNEEDTLELESVVQEQAAFGWEVGRMVSSSSEIAGLTQNSMYMEEEAPEIPGVASLKNKAERLAREYKANLPATMPLMKVTGDSLLYFEEKFVGERGTRSAFYYDFETGKARVYEVTPPGFLCTGGTGRQKNQTSDYQGIYKSPIQLVVCRAIDENERRKSGYSYTRPRDTPSILVHWIKRKGRFFTPTVRQKNFQGYFQSTNCRLC